MFPASGASLPSLLIVQNKSGNVFFVETNETESQIDRILKQGAKVAKPDEEPPKSPEAAFPSPPSPPKRGTTKKKKSSYYEHTPMILR